MTHTLVVFGDSFCCGTGLAGADSYLREADRDTYRIEEYCDWPKLWQDSWGGLIAKRNNMHYLNLAFPGASNMMINRKVHEFYYQHHDRLDDYVFLIFWSGKMRIEATSAHPGEEQYLRLSPLWEYNDKTLWTHHFMRMFKEFMFNEQAQEWQSFQNILSANTLMSHNNARYVSGFAISDTNDDHKRFLVEKFPSHTNDIEIAHWLHDSPELIFPCYHPNIEGNLYVADALRPWLSRIGLE